jgi:hypothetical protein
VKRPQWITAITGIAIVFLIYFFGKTVPEKKPVTASLPATQNLLPAITSDSILSLSKKELAPGLLTQLKKLEKELQEAANSEGKLAAYHRLSHFWSETARLFEPYAWYEGEAARLENSEKSLNFAARLFLDNLQIDNDPERVRWKALQAKDLFERSLKLNPMNDSAKVGLGASYLFGNISAAPMEGIARIREVAERDSTNTYAQMMLAKGSVISGQYDKAITRLMIVNRVDPRNLEAILMLADLYERMNEKEKAVNWYGISLQFINREDIRNEITKRIEELKN